MNIAVVWIGKKSGNLVEAELKSKTMGGGETTEKVYISVKSFFKRAGGLNQRGVVDKQDLISGKALMDDMVSRYNESPKDQPPIDPDQKIKQDAQRAAQSFSKSPFVQHSAAIALEILMKVPKTSESYQEALRAAQNPLRAAGLTGMLVTRVGKDGEKKVRVVVARDDALGVGANKNCHIAIRIGGKDASVAGGIARSRPANYKMKVTFSSTSSNNSPGFREEVSDSAKYSEILRRDPNTRDLFMKYKTVEYLGQQVLMADFADGGELFDKLVADNPWQNSQERNNYCEDLLKAGTALETVGLCHRDIKPENIFIKNGKLVVADFGTIHSKGTNFSIRGTSGYIPPRSQDMNSRHDPYSIGMVLLTMATSSQFHGGLVTPENSTFPDEAVLNNLCAHLRLADPNRYPMAPIILSLLSTEKEEQGSITQAMERYNSLKLNAEQQGKQFNTDLTGLIADAGTSYNVAHTTPKHKNPNLDEFGRKKVALPQQDTIPADIPAPPSDASPTPPTRTPNDIFTKLINERMERQPGGRMLKELLQDEKHNNFMHSRLNQAQARDALKAEFAGTFRPGYIDPQPFGVRWSVGAKDFVLDVIKRDNEGNLQMIEVTLTGINAMGYTNIRQAALDLAMSGQLRAPNQPNNQSQFEEF